MVERYPNLQDEVGGSLLGCEISSLLDKNLSGGQLPPVLWCWHVGLLSQKHIIYRELHCFWSKTTLNYRIMVERYPNLQDEVGGSLLGCEISSLLDKNLSGGQLPPVLWCWHVGLLSQKHIIYRELHCFWSKTTLNYRIMVERYPNLHEEVGGSLPGCEISSTWQITIRWSIASCALALACWYFVSKTYNL